MAMLNNQRVYYINMAFRTQDSPWIGQTGLAVCILYIIIRGSFELALKNNGRNPLSFVGNNPWVCESVDPKSDAPFSSKIHQSDTFQLSRRSAQQAQSDQCPCSTIGRWLG